MFYDVLVVVVVVVVACSYYGERGPVVFCFHPRPLLGAICGPQGVASRLVVE